MDMTAYLGLRILKKSFHSEVMLKTVQGGNPYIHRHRYSTHDIDKNK